MSADLTTLADALKECYPKARFLQLIYKDAPFLARVPKEEKFPGSKVVVPVRYGISQGVSATFTYAQTLSTATSSLIERFELQRKKKFGIAVIDGETIKATASDEGAFVKALTEEIDSCLLALKRRLAWDLYRNGHGRVGTVGSIAAGGSTITLANTEDVVGWEKGMVIQACTTEDSGVLHNSGATLTVSAVNRATGVITFSAGVTATIAAITTSDSLFAYGDRHNNATPTQYCIAGLKSWVPQSAPATTDSFLGVNRSVDPTRLAGQRVDGSAVPIEEALIDGAVQVGREAGNLSDYYVSFGNWAKLEKALGARVRYSEESINGTAGIAFKAIEISGPGGTIKVFADAYCPADTAFGLSLDSWKLRSMGPMISVLDEDGLNMLRQSTANGYESRHAFYGELSTDAPGHNVNVKLSTTASA